jgi:N-acetylmuramoyl-L-alanine amidase
MLVAHDPGHGHDGDIGCQHNGIIEANLVLAFAGSIAAAVPEAQHLLLRDETSAPSYLERAIKAHSEGASIVLLHHINANEDPACHGLMSFYSPDDELGHLVALAIAHATPAPLWRGGHASPATTTNWPRVLWCLMHYRKFGLPAVLIEWGFATNAKDADYLKSMESRTAIITCAAAGIAQVLHAGGST